MREPVLDEAAIEAVVRRKAPLGLLRDALLMARIRDEVRRDIAAYFAALDREALIARAAQGLADAYHDRREEWHDERAPIILAALGLIPTEGGEG